MTQSHDVLMTSVDDTVTQLCVDDLRWRCFITLLWQRFTKNSDKRVQRYTAKSWINWNSVKAFTKCP